MATDQDERDDDEEQDADEHEGDDAGESGEGEEEAHAEASREKPAALEKPKAAPPVRPQPIRAAEPPPPPPPAMFKRLLVFGVVVVTLFAGFIALPTQETYAPGPSAAAKWKVGQQIDADITLVREDAEKLACGSPVAVNGRKCEYSNKTDKNDNADDQHTLKPYTTVDQIQFLAAGMWSQLPKDKLPADRFTVHCKYHVEGVVKSPLVRWDPKMPWGEKNPDWIAGYLTDCRIN